MAAPQIELALDVLDVRCDDGYGCEARFERAAVAVITKVVVSNVYGDVLGGERSDFESKEGRDAQRIARARTHLWEHISRLQSPKPLQVAICHIGYPLVPPDMPPDQPPHKVVVLVPLVRCD